MKIRDFFSSRKRLKELLAACLATYGIVIAMICVMGFRLKWAERLDNMVYDLWMTISPQPRPHHLPVIVDIDERSIEEFGQWPWPRHLLASMVDKIHSSGASSIALDILLSEPDRSSPDIMASELLERLGVAPDFGDIPPYYLNNDLLFRDTIKDKPVILGISPVFDGPEDFPASLPKHAGLTKKKLSLDAKFIDYLPSAQSVQIPLPLFNEVAAVGSMTSDADPDGVIRKVPLITKVNGETYANLGLRALLTASGRNTISMFYGKNGLEQIGIMNLRVPVSLDGYFYPLFRQPHDTFKYYSAMDVLGGLVGPEELKDKIVFVGSSAFGLKDLRVSPNNNTMPGVEMHATIAGNILRGKGLIKPAWSADFQIATISFLTLLAALLFVFTPAAVYIPAYVLIMGFCMFGSWAFFFYERCVISPVYAMLGVTLAALTLLPNRIIEQERLRRELKSTFSHYVAEGVIEKIIKDGGRPLAGEKRHVTVLFTDIRNFSGISEKLPPEKLVELLNRYFTPMSHCITVCEGTMDKFIGDALMAFWNAPLSVESHQIKAVESSMRMLDCVSQLRPQFKDEYGINLDMGIGLHSGSAYVGNMGSNELHDYTCIGENVNLASRLEGLCKVYGAKVIVSSTIKAACGDSFYFRELDHIMVKGSTTPMRIFMPLAAGSQIEENNEAQWLAALDAYYKGDFGVALKNFTALADKPQFEKSAQVFITRCQTFAANPPAYWEGVWKYETK